MFPVAVIAAFEDFAEGLRLFPLWWRLGLDSTASRYRRTLLGPFWIASTTIATAIALAIVFGTIFGGDWRQNFPFIMSGVVLFSFISTLVSEGSQVFYGASGVMQIKRLPLSFHVFLMLDRVVINFAHQLIAFWLVMAALRLLPLPHWSFIFSFVVVLGTGFFIAVPLAMVSIRFRDVSYFIIAALQALFTLTPVFWRREQISHKIRWIVDYNPFAHMLEILRQPLLGHPMPVADLQPALLLFGSSAIFAFLCLMLFKKRVVFWL